MAMKTQAVGMMYLTTALLAHPDKKLGRQLAQKQMTTFQNTSPVIYHMLTRKYQVYKLLSSLHVSKNTWDRFLNSKIYNRLRNR
jgi:hypothetical protein